MKLRTILALGGALLGTATTTFANDEQPDRRIHLLASFTSFASDSDRPATGDNGGWNIGLGTHLSHRFGAEIIAGHTDVAGGTAQKLDTLGVQVLFYPYGREFGLVTLLGGGQQTTEIGGTELDGTYYDIGLGFAKRMSRAGTVLRGDIRVRHDKHDGAAVFGGHNSFNDPIVNLGLAIPFGENKGSRYGQPKWGGELDKRFYVSLLASHTIADDEHAASDGTGWLVAVGGTLSQKMNMEFRANSTTLDALTGSGETKITGWGLDFPVFMNRHPTFSPYALAGIGRAEIESSIAGGQSVEGTTSDFGVGFISTITSYQLGIRFDVRYRNHHDGATLADGIVNLGLHLPIGSSPKAPDQDEDGVPDKRDNCPFTPRGTQVDADGCPLDSDNDGVIDPNDACPDTPPGTEVDARGCKLDGDADGDGVADSQDECPGTAEDTEVGNDGCARDLDGDGVNNNEDQCPNTPEGLTVDNSGCVVEQTVILEGVNFPFNKAVLTANARRILDTVADSLIANPSLSAEVAGHTDWQGNADFNLELSELRAQVVANYLIEQGVDSNNLTSVGYGETAPIGDNHTQDGRSTNRRVELVVKDE